MMKNIAKLTLIALLVANSSMAQKRVTIKKIESRLITNEGIEFIGTLRDKNSDEYMFPRWSNSGIIFVDNKMYGIGNINFNISTNSVDSRITQDKLFMFQSSSVDSISINNHLFKKVGTMFYEVLFENHNNMLLKKYDVKYEKVERGRMGVVKGSGKTYIEANYIVVKPDNKRANIELNKKSVLQTFENESDVLENYAKEENLSFRKEEDVIKMLKYLSSTSS